MNTTKGCRLQTKVKGGNAEFCVPMDIFSALISSIFSAKGDHFRMNKDPHQSSGAGAWTRTSRIFRALPEELYEAFTDPVALVACSPQQTWLASFTSLTRVSVEDIECRCSTRRTSAFSVVNVR
jgi:hypothetical protein